jgi:TonB family protein
MIDILLGLASALAFSGAEPIDPRRWATYADYPAEAFRGGDEGTTAIRLLVDPQGRVEKCYIILSSGSKSLDSASCQLPTRRARFRPATNVQGELIYATYDTTINWAMLSPNGKYQKTSVAETVLTINKLPAGFDYGQIVRIEMLISDNGAVLGCKAVKDEAVPKLAALACTRLVATMQPEPLKNAPGANVESVRLVPVRFVDSRPVPVLPKRKLPR